MSDVSGTGFWRHIQPMLAMNGIAQQYGLNNTYTQSPVVDQNYYKGITSVTVQRWISDQQETMFSKFLKPLCDVNNAWLIYGIDDAMHYDEIPLYNRGRQAFANDKIQKNITQMLNTADFVVVTTKYIKQYYHEKYGVPLENIIAVPNMLPRWWIDDKFDIDHSLKQFSQNKAKPRIGIVSSLSHYNIDNVREDSNGKAVKCVKDSTGTEKWINQDNVEINYADTKQITDDIDEIIETIEQTINDVQWVFFGFCPPKLQKYVDAKKIEVHGGVSILNYPSKLKRLNLQAIVAPLKKMTFNFCKSPIKYLECCALGIPLFASDCQPYTTCMDKKFLFKDAADLKEKILKLKFSSAGIYRSIIESNYKWFNSPHFDGDFYLKNYWLEDNLQIWVDLSRMRPKTMGISFSKFVSQYEAKRAERKEKAIYSNDATGVDIIR